MSNASLGGVMPASAPRQRDIAPTITATVAAVQGLISGSIQNRLPDGPFAFGPFPPSDNTGRNRSVKQTLAVASFHRTVDSRKSMDGANRAKGPDPNGIGFRRIRRNQPLYNY